MEQTVAKPPLLQTDAKSQEWIERRSNSVFKLLKFLSSNRNVPDLNLELKTIILSQAYRGFP